MINQVSPGRGEDQLGSKFQLRRKRRSKKGGSCHKILIKVKVRNMSLLDINKTSLRCAAACARLSNHGRVTSDPAQRITPGTPYSKGLLCPPLPLGSTPITSSTPV